MIQKNWVDAIFCACHLINRMSSVLHDKLAFHCLFLDKPTFSVVPHVFSFTCFIQNFKSGIDTLEPKAIKCVFIGYSRTHKGFCCFDPINHRFYTSSDATFFESVPYFAPPGSPSMPQHMISSRYPEKEIVPKPLQVYIKRSKSVAPTSLQAIPIPTTAHHVLFPSSASVNTNPPPPTVKTDSSTYGHLVFIHHSSAGFVILTAYVEDISLTVQLARH